MPYSWQEQENQAMVVVLVIVLVIFAAIAAAAAAVAKAFGLSPWWGPALVVVAVVALLGYHRLTGS
jgi:uncharacterized membrane protein YkvI